ncbi:class I SAM-dependent methyltransferase [Gammaproteobacteria bacterium]|nr:class I SAM-dependent methyltransferase [Gammaproteobacteria bacterium]
MTKNTKKFLEAYMKGAFKDVPGWLGPDTVSQLVRINSIQEEHGIDGHVGEIGVHHGRLFILLYLMASGDQQALAIDIFGQQDLNVDKSGRGDLSILKANLQRYAGSTSKLKVIDADSTSIGGEEVKTAATGCLRLFSIDGGHMAHIVRHDLRTAASSICDGGVIILDDYFNPEFPGVSEGTNHFFLFDSSKVEKKIVPFFVAMNKIYFTTDSYAERYIGHFSRRDLGIPNDRIEKFRAYDGPDSPIRITEMFGYRVLSYSPDRFNTWHRCKRSIDQKRRHIRETLGDSKTWAYLKNSKIGWAARRVADKLLPY